MSTKTLDLVLFSFLVFFVAAVILCFMMDQPSKACGFTVLALVVREAIKAND